MCLLLCASCGVCLGVSPWCDLDSPCGATHGGPREDPPGGDSWVCLDCLEDDLKDAILADHPGKTDQDQPDPGVA